MSRIAPDAQPDATVGRIDTPADYARNARPSAMNGKA
jgi:hypothetical protein